MDHDTHKKSCRKKPPGQCRGASPRPRSHRRGIWGILLGFAALLWVLFRTGTKPSRVSYPCQQSALALALTTFAGPFVVLIIASRAGAVKRLRSRWGKLIGGLCGSLILALWASASFDLEPVVQRMSPPQGHHPDLYFVRQARGANPHTFGGVDDLVTLMGVKGFKLHRSTGTNLTSGPEGLIETDGVVLLKINAQWPERGGTNTDVVRGVIRNIVEHPDGFVGEIVVADNGQGYGYLDRADSNAEDVTQSITDVVADFADEGWRVSARLWDGINEIPVVEYDLGDHRDGYVVGTSLDPQTSIRTSYPKFQTVHGTFISYKYGVWDPDLALYDIKKLAVINMPVLKTHAIYGITASVKNFMGVVTRQLSTDSHNGVGRGGMGTILADVRMPDLTILDAIWILARPGFGPAAWYDNASFTNQLAASTDPVALDMWAAHNILIPQIIANGYEPSTWSTKQDPGNPDSVFRNYLDRSMNEMLLATIPTTNEIDDVTLHVWTGDWDSDGDIDLVELVEFAVCAIGPAAPLEGACSPFDFDANGHADLRDFASFQNLFTSSFK